MCLSSAIIFSQGKVKSTVIDLHLEKTTLHSAVFTRMQETVRIVAEKIIIGQDISVLTLSKSTLEDTLQGVFSSAMSGFSISAVKLNVGEITGISIYLTPSSEPVQSVKIEVVCPQVEKSWQNTLQMHIETLAPQINSILIGIPLESFTWMQYGLNNTLGDLIQSSNLFPGFLTNFEFSFLPKAKIKIKLEPKQPVVRQTKIKLTSTTLPNIHILQIGYLLQLHLNKLVGLPLEYITYQEDKIKQDIINIIASSKWKKYFFVISVDIISQEVLEVVLNVDSKRYSSYVMGYIDMGREKGNTVEIRGYLGRKITSSVVIFIRPTLILSNLEMVATGGVGGNIHPYLFAAIENNLKEKKSNLYLILKKDKIRGSYIGDYFRKTQEVSLGYKFREFIILEIARKEKEYGLRGVIIF